MADSCGTGGVDGEAVTRELALTGGSEQEQLLATGHGTEFGVLAHLATGVTQTSAQLAREVLVRQQSITAIVDGLVRRGLVQRSGERKKGWANPIELSAAGESLLAGRSLERPTTRQRSGSTNRRLPN